MSVATAAIGTLFGPPWGLPSTMDDAPIRNFLQREYVTGRRLVRHCIGFSGGYSAHVSTKPQNRSVLEALVLCGCTAFKRPCLREKPEALSVQETLDTLSREMPCRLVFLLFAVRGPALLHYL